MQPLISVIVPIYKVEPYLRRCLDSIVNQTYTNLEIILVDDGSPDGCPAICDEYAAKDNRIVVIHKENGGLSDARNAGLDIAKGEWISFVDSDDWIAENFVEILLEKTLSEEADLSICNFQKVFDQKNFLKIKSTPEITLYRYSPVDAVKQLWSKNGTTFVTAWGKLYKTSLFHSIRYPKGLIHEDEYTTYKVLYESKKTIFIDIPLYFYLQRSDSIMGGAKKNSIRVLKANLERYRFFQNLNEISILDDTIELLCGDLLYAYSEAKLFNKFPIGFENSEFLLKSYQELVKDYFRSPNKKLPVYLFHAFFSKSPYLYLLYRKISPKHLREF